MSAPAGATPSALSRRSAHARPARPWALVAASLILAGLAMVLWAKWVESRSQAALAEAELRRVHVETQAVRTLTARERGRVATLEREVQTLRAERARMVERLEALEATVSRGGARPGRADAR
jgi:hypothetical protein